MFVIQTIEAKHAIREGIIEDAGMANLASVLGWSYPAARGGVLNYPDLSVAKSLSGFAFDCRRNSEIDLQCRGSLGRRMGPEKNKFLRIKPVVVLSRNKVEN